MNTVTKILALALAFALAVCLWQRAAIARLEADAAKQKAALAKAREDLLFADKSTTARILGQRDTAYADIHQAALAATAIIFSTPQENKAHDTARLDSFVPRALSDALIVQQQGVRPGSGGNSPTGVYVLPQNATTSPCDAKQTNDCTPNGGMALQVHSLGSRNVR